MNVCAVGAFRLVCDAAGTDSGLDIKETTTYPVCCHPLCYIHYEATLVLSHIPSVYMSKHRIMTRTRKHNTQTPEPAQNNTIRFLN